jgi:hypothetical protein
MSNRMCATPSTSSPTAPVSGRAPQSTARDRVLGSPRTSLARILGKRGVVGRVRRLVLSGAMTVFALILVFSDGNAAAATIVGMSGLAFAVHRRTAIGRRDAAAPPSAVDLAPCQAPDDTLSPAMMMAVAQFAPRLLRLTRLVHGPFSRVDDVGFWQSDVVLAAYVTGLVAGRGGLGRPPSSPRSLLAHFIGPGRADAALARRCSGVTPWTNGLFGLIESVGCMDGVRLHDEWSGAHAPALSKECGHG